MFGGRAAALAGGMAAAEEDVEQHAQRIDVGGRGDRAAGYLLRGGVLRGERAAARGIGEGGAARLRASLRHELGDSEVEQLHGAVGRDQDVRRLEVAMDDQIGVRVAHGLEHGEKQAQPCLDVRAGARRKSGRARSPSTCSSTR